MKLDKFSSVGVRISPLAKIGKNVKIGDNTIIYDNVLIGDNTIICNDCVIGEPLNEYYGILDDYENPPTVIGANSLIRSHTIIYADNVFGEGFQTGHRVTIREKTIMGEHCSVGTLSDIQGHSTFGNYVRMHSNVHIGQKSQIGSYCWIYPYTVFTNDPTPPSEICVGPTVGDYSIVATHCLLLPGVVIGRHCLIGAFSMVFKNVADYTVAVGSPAKPVKDIREVKDRETGEAHYPWPLRFERNMPWKEVGYEKWLQDNNLNNNDLMVFNKQQKINALSFKGKEGGLK